VSVSDDSLEEAIRLYIKRYCDLNDLEVTNLPPEYSISPQGNIQLLFAHQNAHFSAISETDHLQLQFIQTVRKNGIG
jgi:hypothetical protein